MLEAVAANGAGVVDGLFARCVIVVVVVIVVRLVDASERHARNRTVDDPWQFDGCVVFVVVLETKLCVVIVVVVARIADNGAALVGQLRRIVLGLVELVLLGALRALEVANHGGEHAGEGVDLMRTKRKARLQVRLVGGQHALKAERQCVAAPIFGRWRGKTRFDLVGGFEVGAGPEAARANAVGVVGRADALANPTIDCVERRTTRHINELCACSRIAGFEHSRLQPPRDTSTTTGRLSLGGSAVPNGTEHE